MKQLLAVFFILNLLNGEGQSIDSLRSVASVLKHDTDKVSFFYKEGFAYRILDPQYSYDCAIEAENYAQRSSKAYYVAKASTLLGILYYRKGDYTTALSYHKKALGLRLLVNDKAGQAISQTNLGNVLSSMQLYQLAEAAYLKAIALNYELGQQEQVGNCLMNLGVLQTELKNINAAENYFNEAIVNAKQRFDYELQASCLNNLAVLNIMKKDYDAAIGNALNSVKIKGLMDNDPEMADGYLNLSDAYFQKKEFAKGLACLRIADSIIDKYDYPEAKLEALDQHADYDAQNKNFEGAYMNLKNYQLLKDSLDEINAAANTDNNFVENKISSENYTADEKEFPYLLLITLCVICISGAVFLFRFKR